MLSCNEIKPRLGELLDGELEDSVRHTVEVHLDGCESCRDERESLRAIAAALAPGEQVSVPGELWSAIETRLDQESAKPDTGRSGAGRRIVRGRRIWQPLATAAAILLMVGLGWGLLQQPGSSTAMAHTIDFRPLLNRVGGDLEQGVRALLNAYDGRVTSLAEAANSMTVRVHPPEKLPGGMSLKSTYMLNMGNHTSLALHFAGPSGQLLVMQCPPGMQKEYGGRECLPCQVGSRSGQIVREGPWRLVHMESDNVCICVVSTLDETTELPAVLKSLRIDY